MVYFTSNVLPAIATYNDDKDERHIGTPPSKQKKAAPQSGTAFYYDINRQTLPELLLSSCSGIQQHLRG